MEVFPHHSRLRATNFKHFLLPMHKHTPRATADFESRSECSLRNHGSWRYSLDPTTEVLCLAYRLPHWARGRTGLWHPAFPHLDIQESEDVDDLSELFRWVGDGGLIEAHNAWFERGIWKNIMAPSYGFPDIAHEQWRCSAAKAAAHSLPRALEDVAEVTELEIVKDLEGHKVMKSMMKPRKATKADKLAWAKQHEPCPHCDGAGRVGSLKKDGTPTKKGIKCPACHGAGYGNLDKVPPMPILWHESKELMERLWVYCRQDVLAEEELSVNLPDLSPLETQIYLTDQAVNERGFQLDPEAIAAALDIIDEECVDLNAELQVITGGKVEKATQRDRMLDWFETQNLFLDNTQAATLDAILAGESGHPSHQNIAVEVRRAIELMRALGKSSTAKFVKMKDWICPDNRVHGGLLFHGASTGRWSGAGIQPHNFPKGKLKDMEDVWNIIKYRRRDVLPLIFADKDGNPLTVMDCLSSALRGAIVSAPGKQLYVADYASIEARVLLWLADDTEALKVFEEGRDIYCYMADDIYGYSTNKNDHPKERGIGKIAVLGLGYQMGPAKFVVTCALGGVEIVEDAECAICGYVSRKHRKQDRDHAFEDSMPGELTAVKIVDAYRAKFWRVKQMWNDQEAAAMKAVQTGRRIRCGKVYWFVEEDFLYCELPSGRRLAYPEPEINETWTSWGELRDILTFKGINIHSRKWERLSTYGGMLTENIVQAVARDLMAEAMLRCEESETYEPVLTVHDELIAEAVIGTGNVKEFEHLMATCPPWARGCPVEAEGWAGFRYHK